MTNETLQQFLNLGYDLIYSEAFNIDTTPTALNNPGEVAAVFISSNPTNIETQDLFIGDNAVNANSGFPLFARNEYWDGAALRPLYIPTSIFIQTTAPENFYLVATAIGKARVLYLKLRQL